MGMLISRERYDELLERDDTEIKIEEKTFPAELWFIANYRDDETALTIATEMGLESLEMPGPLICVTFDSEDKTKVSVWYWQVGV